MTKSPRYNKDAVDKELKKVGAGEKASKLTHKLLKGRQKADEAVNDESALKSYKVTYQTTKGKTSSCTIKARDENEAKAKCRRKPNYGGNASASLMESQLTEGVLDDQDDDGFMAKRQLYDIAKYAVELHRMIQDTDNLEPWVQAKITKAADYIDTVKHYLEYQGVRDAEGIAADMGAPDMDIDAVGSEVDSMPRTTEVMEYGDEDEGSEVYAEDVLYWAVLRGIITSEQDEQATLGQNPNLMMAAQDVADSIGHVWEIGSSDISIWMREFVNAAKGYGVTLAGEKAHIYESQFKAKMIYRNMLSELRKKK